MRACIVSPYDPRPSPEGVAGAHVGGVEESLRLLAEALSREGLDVVVLATGAGPGSVIRQGGVEYRTVKRVGVLFRAPVSALPFRVPGDVDVVHVPATYPTLSDLIPLFRRIRGLPTVVDYHFEPVATSRAMALSARAYRWSFAPLARLADRVVVKSEEYAGSSRILRRLPRDRLRVVPNGVDVDRFPIGQSDGEGVLCVGRLIPYKGVEVLLEAMREVQASMGRVPLVVAGDGPLRGSLEKRARDLGVDATFLGYVPEGRLPYLYARARLTVLPSVNRQEAFGITLLESMAAGTPVVASELAGVRSVATLGGLTARPGDPGDLSRTIQEALKGDLPRGRELRERVQHRFAWPAIARRMREVYEEIVRP